MERAKRVREWAKRTTGSNTDYHSNERSEWESEQSDVLQYSSDDLTFNNQIKSFWVDLISICVFDTAKHLFDCFKVTHSIDKEI